MKDFAYTINWETNDKWTIVPGTTASWIMGCFTPQALPVMSALAKGYAVCDHWFSSAPTETLPNRAFALAGHQPGAHGRPHQDLHLPVHLRRADQGRA